MRAFLAIPLPDALAEELAELSRSIEGLSAQKAATLHLTVRFLGDVEEEVAAQVGEAAAAVAARHAPFALHLRGLGAFPPKGPPRVVWVGLEEGAEEAIALAADLEAALGPLGFPPERRPFRPHVTLGRFRRRPPRPPDLDPERDLGRAPADRLVLYRSTLTPQGAVHDPFQELSLGRAT